MTKIAVFSMDVEDWWHLDYFRNADCDRAYSLADGLERYLELLESHKIPSTFFVMGEVLRSVRTPIECALRAGHEIGSHGWDARPGLTLSEAEFRAVMRRAQQEIAEVTGQLPLGYRAHSFSLDRPRLDIVRDLGFGYDSSRIRFGIHPRYGSIDVSGFIPVRPWVFRDGDFFEFEMSVLRVCGRTVPVAGGGYIRLLPWWMMRALLNRYLARERFYVLYIHPFELSTRPEPPVPAGTSALTRLRFSRGRGEVSRRLDELIRMLKDRGFQFRTLAQFRSELISQPPAGRG